MTNRNRTGTVIWLIAVKLHLPGMKTVIVTYCDSPEEQALAHQQLHSLNG